LVDDLGITDLDVARDGCVVAYHPSCHGLRNVGLRGQSEALLDSVDGLERRTPDEAETCCGFGGLFAVEMPEVSAAILETKLDHLEETGAEIIVGGDISCLMNIGGGLHRRQSSIQVKHIAEILGGE
jgi:L-lactate dehydrogenase complex protein LldE